MKKNFWLVVIVCMVCFSPIHADEIQRSEAAIGAEVFFENIFDGQRVTNPIHLKFGLKNMALVPAGAKRRFSGHHHLIIDAPLPDLNRPIPSSKHYRHFGQAQDRTEIELTPGMHRLQLLFGDFRHTPHQPAVISNIVTIYVSDLH